ncbi:MAG: DUF1887 family CARF protein [Thiolinea sp.]
MPFAADIHLCLVSENIAANLLPILDEQARPRQVVLVYPAALSRYADGLGQVINGLGGIGVSRCLLNEPDCVVAIRKALAEQLTCYQQHNIALNTGGGSRLLSLLAYGLFRSAGKPVFYVDTEANRLIDLSEPEAESYQLSGKMTLEQVLQVRGFEVQQRNAFAVRATHRAFAQELVANIRHYSQALANLHWLAASTASGLSSKPIESWQMASPVFIALLDRLRDLGIAVVNHKCLVFTGEAERWFINGGWLEDYTNITLASLSEQYEQVQDIAAGFTVRQDDEAAREIDTALLVNNRLYLIECRAKKLKKGNAGRGAEALHRADELREMNREFQARSLLLHYCPLREVDVRRLQLMGINVLQEKQLQNLRFYLQEWLFEGSDNDYR